MSEPPRLGRYRWPGGCEALLRFGPDTGPVVVLIGPPFEEANRTRALLVAIARALTIHGIASVLPDLPGTGDSLIPTERLALGDTAAATSALVAALGRERPVHVATIRGGCLLGGGSGRASAWQFAPIGGEDQLRELLRVHGAAGGRLIEPGGLKDEGPPIEIAGNLLSQAMLRSLGAAATPAAARIVRLDSDRAAADAKLAGAPAWRRSEPLLEPALAAALADDLAAHVRRDRPRPDPAGHAPAPAPADPAAAFEPVQTSARHPVVFTCAGEALVGTLDPASGPSGLLVVSGGNEVRIGAHRGMALLAARLAASGVPVFRFDRRGLGDSGGANGGWTSSADDIAAALTAFRRAQPQMTRVVGYGNCDAATALALFGRGLDAMVLANPWVVERAAADLPPPAAIRARYAEKLRSPREWLRLLRGGVDLRKLFRGLLAVAKKTPEPALALRFVKALRGREATIVLATGDATAIAFADATGPLGLEVPVMRIATASHSFAREGDAAALEAAIRKSLPPPNRSS